MGLKYERKIILIVQIVRNHGTDSRMTTVGAKPSGGKKRRTFFRFRENRV